MPNKLCLVEVASPHADSEWIYVDAPNADLAEEAAVGHGYRVLCVFDPAETFDPPDVVYQTNPTRYAAAMLNFMLYSDGKGVSVPGEAFDLIDDLIYELFGDDPESHPDYQKALKDWEAT